MIAVEQTRLASPSILQLTFVLQSNLSVRPVELADLSGVDSGCSWQRAVSASALLPFGLASPRRSIASWRYPFSVAGESLRAISSGSLFSFSLRALLLI